MTADVDTKTVGFEQKHWLTWTGRVLSALPALMMLASAAMKLTQQPRFVATFVGTLGYPARVLVPIGLLELACVLLYLVPQTALLGAIALSAYLGGAVATHVRIGEPFATPVVIGLLVWAGLYLRDPRVRALVPLR